MAFLIWYDKAILLLFLLLSIFEHYVSALVPSLKTLTTRKGKIFDRASEKYVPRYQSRWLHTTRSRINNNVLMASSSITAEGSKVMTQDEKAKSIGKLVFLLPHNGDNIKSKFGTASPVSNPSLLEAAQHIAQKSVYYAEGMLETEVITLPISNSDDNRLNDLLKSEIVIAYGLQTDEEIDFAQKLFEQRRNIQDLSIRKRLMQFAIECTKPIPAMIGPYDPTTPSVESQYIPWSDDATGRRMYEQMIQIFNRWTSDDYCYAFMLFLNQFSGSKVNWVKYQTDATWEKGPIQNMKEFYTMIDKCSDCIVPCLQDDQCRECLNKLTELDTRDQAASYRTLVSYESDLLTNFSLCIFTKNNVFQSDAQIPTLPKVTPISSWRGQPITEEIAKSLLVAHLENEDNAPDGSLGLSTSWIVACGANVAYDQFPSQNQIFYNAVRGRDMWYDPVFRVETLDGRNVWCKRHYKVRPQKVPGTFRFSVLDNGVTSDEFWTIVGAADDLSWIVFHYAGAAKAAGLQYLGGLLCTPDGSMPDESQLPVIWDLFRSAGIEPWELYQVDNRVDSPSRIDAGPPPLEYYRKAVQERKANAASVSST